MNNQTKKAYVRPQGPQLKLIGSVADLTHTGATNGGSDGKFGSKASAGV